MTQGVLHLVGRWRDGGVDAVAIRNARPHAARVLVGRPVAEALGLVPLLFSLCGRAQGLAATAACAAAGAPGVVRPDAALAERDITIETAQEHLWRLMLDWPALFGHEPRRNRFAELHRRLARVEQDPSSAFQLGGDLLDLVATQLLAGFFRSMREPRGLAEFIDCAEFGGSIGETLAALIRMGSSTPDADAVALSPACSAADWAARLGGMPDPAYCAAPTFDGRAMETGALARQADARLVKVLLAHGHRIAARLFARIIELGDCASRLRHPLQADLPPLLDAAPCGEWTGLACAQTARGVLIHVVRVEGERIADYAVIAPTEWNFHPDGAFAREGVGWQASDRDAALLRLRALALSLDPCVEFDVQLTDTDTDTDSDSDFDEQAGGDQRKGVADA